MSIWQTITWNVARSAGFTAFGLLTAAVAIGLVLTLQLQSPQRWPRIINSELHNFLTLLALVFTGVHIIAVWVDPFTKFGWNEVLLPFVSHYRPIWMAFGIVGLYLGIAVGLSTLLRPYIGYKLWRSLHILTIFLYASVLIHGITTGSDTRTWWGAGIYLVSALSVGILLWVRLMRPATAQTKAHPGWALIVVAFLAIGAFLTLLGPLQPDWNAVANNNSGSGGASTASAASPQKSSSVQQNQGSTQTGFPQSFTADVQGQLTQSQPTANGNVTINLDLGIQNGPSGKVQVVLQGLTGSDGGINITSTQMTMASTATTQRFVGPLTDLTAARHWRMAALLNDIGSTKSGHLQVLLNLLIDQSGQASGTITASSAIQPSNGSSNGNGTNNGGGISTPTTQNN